MKGTSSFTVKGGPPAPMPKPARPCGEGYKKQNVHSKAKEMLLTPFHGSSAKGMRKRKPLHRRQMWAPLENYCVFAQAATTCTYHIRCSSAKAANKIWEGENKIRIAKTRKQQKKRKVKSKKGPMYFPKEDSLRRINKGQT